MNEGYRGWETSTVGGCGRAGAARWRQRTGWTWIALAATALLAASCCSPSIDNFNVAPPRTCSDHAITVSWKTSGATTLQVTPKPAADGDGALKPNTRVLQFVLFAGKGGEKKHSEKDVHVFATGARIKLAFPADIKGNELVADRKIDAGRWSDAVRIVKVGADWSGAGSTPPRPIHVRHDAHEATLSAHQASDKLAGTPVGGEWALDAPLLDGETHPPKRFHLYITAACSH